MIHEDYDPRRIPEWSSSQGGATNREVSDIENICVDGEHMDGGRGACAMLFVTAYPVNSSSCIEWTLTVFITVSNCFLKTLCSSRLVEQMGVLARSQPLAYVELASIGQAMDLKSSITTHM